jgi:F-type H+-transporting ATPase subunit a
MAMIIYSRSPLDQFEIRDLINIDAPILGYLHLSITNIGLYLIIATFLAFFLNILATNYSQVVSNN